MARAAMSRSSRLAAVALFVHSRTGAACNAALGRLLLALRLELRATFCDQFTKGSDLLLGMTPRLRALLRSPPLPLPLPRHPHPPRSRGCPVDARGCRQAPP